LSFGYRLFLFANIISLWGAKVADLPIIAVGRYCGISATFFALCGISFAQKLELCQSFQ
jgi:hypothetical protein